MKKIDSRLAHELAALRETRSARDAAHAPGRRIGVFVQFTGDLDKIRQRGLAVQTVLGDVAIGTAELDDIEKIAALENVISIEGELHRRPQLKVSVPEIRANHIWNAPLSLKGEKVIVGIVDTGVDIFHQSLRDSDGKTRILSILDMTHQRITIIGAPTGGTFTLSATPPGAAPGTPALTTAPLPHNAGLAQIASAFAALPGFSFNDLAVAGGPLPGKPATIGFIGKFANKSADLMTSSSTFTGGTAPRVEVTRGREFTDDEINHALTAYPTPPFHHTDFDGHGTHVAGTAAGDGSQSGGTPTDAPLECTGDDTYIGVAPRADLVIVKTTFHDTDNVAGVAHVFQVAQAKSKAAVVNLSLGGQIGPHDGTSREERLLDDLLVDTTNPTRPPLAGRAIVVSAGNDGAAGLHASGRVPGGGTISFQFIVPPGDKERDFFDLWYAGPGRLRFTLTSPPGAPTNAAAMAAVNPGDAQPPQTIPGHDVVIISSLNNSRNNKHRIYFEIAPAPPPPGGAAGTIATGPWTITLQETAGSVVDFDCWIDLQKKDKNPSFRDVDVDRTRTLTIPGTARNVITVGAYDAHNGTLADFSSVGPALTPAAAPDTLPPDPATVPDRAKPDIAAPGVGVIAPRSGERSHWYCCDCCQAFYVAMDGTSMAAPHITGVVALMLQRNKTLTFDDIRTRLRASAAVSVGEAGRTPPPPPPLPNNEWGPGKIEAEAVVTGVPAHPRVAAAVPVPVLFTPAVEPAILPAERVPEMQWLAKIEMGNLLAALVSTHFDEVLRLIHRNRRVATLWHRLGGPALVRQVMITWRGASGPFLPAAVREASFSKYLDRLFAALAHFGSAHLQRDVAKYGALVATMAGFQQAQNRRLR